MALANQLQVFVFSFNRGDSLRDCLNSIRENLPNCPVTVYDDGSTSRETISALVEWSGIIPIHRRPPQVGTGRVGRLHENMSEALDQAKSVGATYALMLQDDMQVVRSLVPKDTAYIDHYFRANPQAAELIVHFHTRERQDPDSEWILDSSQTASLSQNGPQTSYLATGLFHVERAHQRLSPLERTERLNAEKAAELGMTAGFYRYPFTMFMPFPKTFRNGKRKIFLWATETLAGSGVHPYVSMKEKEIAKLFRRQGTAPAAAREWLTCRSVQEWPLWSYYGGARDLRARLGWRGTIGRVLGGAPPKSQPTRIKVR